MTQSFEYKKTRKKQIVVYHEYLVCIVYFSGLRFHETFVMQHLWQIHLNTQRLNMAKYELTHT